MANMIASNGLHVLAWTRRGLVLTDVRTEERRELPAIRDVMAIAVVGDAWWVWSPSRLWQLAFDGTVRAQTSITLGPGRCVVSPYWSVGAWYSGPRSTRYLQGSSGIVATEEPGFVIPVDAASEVIVRAGAAGLRRGGGYMWTRKLAVPGEVIDGSVVFEGRFAGIVVHDEARAEYRVLALDLRNGKVGCNVRLTQMRRWAFAAHRGQILIDSGERLLVLDLRFGTVVHEWRPETAVRDLAVDPALQHAVLLGEDDGLTILDAAGEIVSTRDDHAKDPVVTPVVDEPAIVEEPAPELDVSSSPPASSRFPTTPPEALWPRGVDERTSRDESVDILDHHVTYIATLAARAVAQMWDSGRLARPEDSHLPFYSEVVGILQVERGRARTELEEAEQRCRLAYDRMLDRVRALGERRAPLSVLAREFGLSPLATQILVVIAAPVLRGELARLYGILANDRQRGLVDELMICQILAGSASRADITRELDRESPLRRYGLVVATEAMPRPFHALAIDPLVMRRLRDLPLDGDAEPWLRPVEASCGYEGLRVPREPLLELLAAVHAPPDPRTPLRVVVRGRTSSGRRTVLASIAQMAGRTLGVLDLSRAGHEPAVRLQVLQDGLRRAMLRGWFPCVEGLEELSETDRGARDEVSRVLAEHPGPLAVRLPLGTTPPLVPGYVGLDLPVLVEQERRAVWTDVATRNQLALTTTQLDELASRYRVGVGVVEKVCATIATAGSDEHDAERVEALIKQHLHTRFGQLAQQVTRLATWSDIILPSDIKDSVLELIARVRHRRRVYEEWGFDKRMTTSRGVTSLFAGSPGTGKTMVAGVIANELGLDLYRIDLSRIVSKWIGETERNLAEAFDAAEDGRAILLFDEADSLFGKRTEVKTSTDRYANLEVNYLLQRLDSFEGFAILTTNFSGAIDPAFKRRLTLRLTFPFPDEEMREQLWRVHIPPEMPRHGELDLRSLARRYTMSGGYVRNSVLRAAFLASEEGTPLTQHHLERAVALEFREIGKLSETGTLE